jgi:mono/diheme cytochrome c family protein
VRGIAFFPVLVLAGVAACNRAFWSSGDDAAPAPVRISMQALHQAGGVPQGWRFSPPPGNPSAGKRTFIDFGCYACHAVRGEEFPDVASDQAKIGPDLTGMGSHHPPEYFAESILNPNAVLVEGEGYIDASGRSVMPEYPDMSIRELGNLVAYLRSLRNGGDPNAHMHHQAGASGVRCEAPAAAASYMIQVEEVTSEQVRTFNTWFLTEGAKTLAQDSGVVRFDAYVNRSADKRVLVTVFGFDDDSARSQYMRGLEAPGAAARYGGLLGDSSHIVYRSPVIYKAVGLSIP